MAKYNHFDYVPSTIDRKRSIFAYNYRRGTGWYLGHLYPLCAPIKLMPGSSITLDLAQEIRSGSALIVPLMDEMQCDITAFFVPNRIVWEHWKQFIGAVDDVTYNNLATYTVPGFNFAITDSNVSASNFNFFWTQTLACHYGIQAPYNSSGPILYNTTNFQAPFLNALPFRGYTFIWNQYFRPEQLHNPIVFAKTDTGSQGQNMNTVMQSVTYGGSTLYAPVMGTVSSQKGTGGTILYVCRAHRDLYTSCLPNPSLETMNLLSTVTGFPVSNTDDSPYGAVTLSNNAQFDTDNGAENDLRIEVASGNFDWSNVLLTVNNYRETIMLQNYYDVLNRAGSRYDEIIRNIFGVTASSQLTDIPQLIIHKRFTIYRKEVVSTAETLNSTNAITTPVGSQSAYIDTVIKDNLLTMSCVEHGYLHILGCIRPAFIRMTSGIAPDFFEFTKFDYQYLPQFDGMGDVKRFEREVWYDYFHAYNAVSSTSTPTNGDTFGFQEYGAEEKWQRSDACGWLDPHLPSNLSYYIISDNLSGPPILASSWISCMPQFWDFANKLSVSSPWLAPQFIVEIRLTGSVTKPMPVYNVPGLGALL